MWGFLFGIAVGATGYWAWQSFGKDLLGMGGDQGTGSYPGYSGSTSYGTTTGTGAASTAGATATTPSAGGTAETDGETSRSNA